MKKYIALLLLLSLLLSLCACGSRTELSGSGTEEDPYRISTAEELRQMAALINSEQTHDRYSPACYLITADIDLGSKEWEPIGTYGVGFQGVLDGGGHTVSGVRVSYSHPLMGEKLNQAGFISNLQKGTVRNLTISDSVIQAKGDSIYCAALVGSTLHGTIENCHTTDSVQVTSEYYAAGICGSLNTDNAIVGCTNAATILASGPVSGAAGIAGIAHCAIIGCSNSGTITSDTDAAGIAISAGGGVSGCSNSGSVSAGTGYAAGILCRFSDGALNSGENNALVALDNCVNSGAVTSAEDLAGGIASVCRTGIVQNCINTGPVTAAKESGGIFGYFQISAFGTAAEQFTVSGCINSGTVTSLVDAGNAAAGGICGVIYGGSSTQFLFEKCENKGTIFTSGSTGAANSWGPAGGIVGRCNVLAITFSQCRNSASVTGVHCAGGILGRAMALEGESSALTVQDCANSGDICAVDGEGLTQEIYAGGILGYLFPGGEVDPPFGQVQFSGCSNSGSLTGNSGGANVCTDDLCASYNSQFQ